MKISPELAEVVDALVFEADLMGALGPECDIHEDGFCSVCSLLGKLEQACTDDVDFEESEVRTIIGYLYKADVKRHKSELCNWCDTMLKLVALANKA